MPTPVLDAFTDNSLKDGTGDDIGGVEVDANPTIIAKLLDATSATVLGQDGSTGVRFELMGWFEDANAAASVQDVAFLEWDPADGGNMTDGSSGIGTVWKMPDDADTQTNYARLDVRMVNDAAAADAAEFVLETAVGGTLTTEVFRTGANGTIINDDSNDLDFRVEGANNANLILLDAGQDALSFGGANVDGAALTLNNLTTRTAITSVGQQAHIPAQTQNFDNGSGTIAIGAANFIGIPTMTGDTATLTMTNAATLYIQGAPVASTNVTHTTAGYSLWVDAGTVRFDGGGQMTGTWSDLGTVTTIDINGGTVDGVTIGAAAAPTVTDLGSVATCDINGGSIDGTTIGAASAAAITGTTITANTSFVVGNTTYTSNTITQATGAALNIALSAAAGDDFTVDTTKLVVEGDDGHVGIGTAGPSQMLDVRGTAVTESAFDSTIKSLDDTALAADVGAGILFGGVYQSGGGQTAFAGVRAAKENGTDGQFGAHLDFYSRANGASLVRQFRVAADGGIFCTTLLAAAASTDVNINGSNELHSVTSSAHYKDEITGGVDSDRIYDLKPRMFTWRDPDGVPKGWAQEVGDPGLRDFGLIAEEVYETMPELVNMKDGKPYSVRYQMLSVLLLNELKKLKGTA